MPKLFEYLHANPLVSVLGLIEAALLVHFLIQYVLRGLNLRSQLRGIMIPVQAIGAEEPGTIRSRLDRTFSGTRLARAWREFDKSLHEQRPAPAVSGSGSERGAAVVRATQPAETFFNLETVVDPWIGSEYFKHLPGILTGFGIIGTFFGLIQGLIHFDPSLTDSAHLRSGLGELFGHVRDAFVFSGTAIAAAILVTITEKWLYSSCAKWVFELATALDGMFRTGVGEEYLATLLKTSQESVTQVRELKRSMVEELRSLLTGLTERQIQATRQMSADLGRSIRESLQEPMADIARTVAAASGRETEAVRNVLEQLMASFLTQMRETMGRQLSDLSTLIQQTAHAVYKVEIAMQSLLEDVQKSGQEAATSMQGAVRELMQGLSDSQRAQGEVLSSATRNLLAQLSEAAVRMARAQEEAARRNREESDASAAHVRRQIATVSDSHGATMASTREILDRFADISTEMMDKLTAGAASIVAVIKPLQQTAEQMSRASLELASMQSQNQKTTNDMVRASSHLSAASQTVGNSIHQLGSAAVRFEAVASSASVEANARRQLLISLQDVIDQSQLASREFVKLAQEARKSLDHSVEQFGTDVSLVLTGHVKAYQKQLGDSVSSLRLALDQLAMRSAKDRH